MNQLQGHLNFWDVYGISLLIIYRGAILVSCSELKR